MSTSIGPVARRGSAGPESTDLPTKLLEQAIALTRQHGPDGVSLREVQRRSGVSPAAAYKHYRDREALLVAVGQRASAMLADAIQKAFDGVPAGSTPGDTAVTRLRAGSAAYLDFAQREPGLYRAVFLTGENPADLADPERASRGSGGLGPYQLLQDCLGQLITHGRLSAADSPWSDTTVWAATHGLAMLFLDGPLRYLDDAQKQQATERLLDVVITGIVGPMAADFSPTTLA